MKRKIFFDIETTGIDTTKDRIIAIGIAKDDEEPVILYNDNEKALLLKFDEIIEEKSLLIGWKIKQFDIPFVTMRSIVNNVKIKKPLYILDLAEFAEKYLLVRGQKPASTDFYRAFDIEHDSLGGVAVPILYQQKDIDRIIEHCRKDIIAIRKLYYRLGGE